MALLGAQGCQTPFLFSRVPSVERVGDKTGREWSTKSYPPQIKAANQHQHPTKPSARHQLQYKFGFSSTSASDVATLINGATR